LSIIAVLAAVDSLKKISKDLSSLDKHDLSHAFSFGPSEIPQWKETGFYCEI
jgi:hypothetical protein